MRTNHLERMRIDKLFDLAVQDAYRLENARLLEQADAIDKTADNPAEPGARLDQSVMRLIRLEQKKHRRLHRFMVARRVAIIVLVILIITSSALMSVEAIRESTIRTLVAWSDKVLNILFNSDPREQQGTSETSATDPASTRGYRPAWLPDGFTLTDEVSDISGKWRMLVYRSADGRQSLTLTQSHLTGGGTLSIDTENALSQEVLVKGLDGILVTSAQPGEGENKLWWKDQGTSFLISANLDPDTMIRVAESLEMIPDS